MSTFQEPEEMLRGRDERSRMIAAQAETITKLHKALRDQQEQHDREILRVEAQVAEIKRYAHFYKTLQETILKYPALMIEWQRFCVLLKLCDPDEAKYNV